MRTSPSHTIPRRQHADTIPLSFAQQRFWFLHQLEPESSRYNIPSAMRLSGAIDPVALEESINAIVLRHEALRTTFPTVGDRPVQRISPASLFHLAVTDLTSLPDLERDAEVRRQMIEEAERPFDLAEGPLLRASLLRLEARDHVLLLTMHHIVSDGWSRRVLFRELSRFYRAFSLGERVDLPELPIQYSDYAVWQRDYLEGEVLEVQLGYWKQQLSDAPTVLELPTDRPHPPAASYRGARETILLPASLLAGLRALSRREEVTLFMTLLAAFQTLLARYTGQADIVVGAPIAGRTRTELAGLIGCFVNSLALRTDLSGDPTFLELLRRVREVALGAYDHHDLPFDRLVDELRPSRDPSRNPFFQVMFGFQEGARQLLELPGVTLTRLEVEARTARFDLSLHTWEEPCGGLRAQIEYSTDLFNAATMARLLGHLTMLIEGIVADPSRRLSALPLLPEAEQRQLLVDWNDTATGYPKDGSLHELFEQQAARTPDAVAAVYEDEQLTYGELNRSANQLAHYLRGLGVGPEKVVGICMERSLAVVVGLLGILKAGGAYLPLDPAYPRERLRFMLDDAKPVFMVTRRGIAADCSGDGMRVVCLDSDRGSWAHESVQNPVGAVGPENSAYVLYTSGSTGKPKGVLVEHRAVLNYVRGISARLGPAAGSGTAFALVQPLTVDSSLTAVYVPLCTGGCLHVISQERASDPVALGEYFRDHRIDCLKIAPSHLAALQAAPDPQLLPRRWLVLGGEAPRRSWVATLQSQAPRCMILNHYGPTEATVGMLTYCLTENEPDCRSSMLPMGRPLPNTRAYLLDAHLQPVPVGVTGELYVGGACLARGYLNQPVLTAERFIPSPFDSDPGARMYRTGDMARYLADGNLEFVGRQDQQVKIHGFRVELGEIEATLGQHPGVREIAVMARKPEGLTRDAPEDKVLVAYLVPNRRPAPTLSELRGFLKERLPEHMVPSAWVLLDALPRTPHGKLDRRAFPVPDGARPEVGSQFLAPRTPLEELLLRIWTELLGLARVGVDDNFFELGGHSLLATMVVTRLRAALGVAVPLRAVFEAPTVAELAVRVEQIRARGGSL